MFTARYELNVCMQFKSILVPPLAMPHNVTCHLIPDNVVRNSDHSRHAAGPGDWLSSAPGWLKATGIPDVSAAHCKEPPSPRTPCPARQDTVFKLGSLCSRRRNERGHFRTPPSAVGLAHLVPTSVLVPAQWNTKHCTSTVAKHIDTTRHVPYAVRSAI